MTLGSIMLANTLVPKQRKRKSRHNGSSRVINALKGAILNSRDVASWNLLGVEQPIETISSGHSLVRCDDFQLPRNMGQTCSKADTQDVVEMNDSTTSDMRKLVERCNGNMLLLVMFRGNIFSILLV